MDYSREYATPSEVSAIRAELIGMNRALRDLQSTSASTSFRLAKSGENDAPGLQDILIRALVAQFIANKELHSPGGGPPAEEVAERFYGRGAGRSRHHQNRAHVDQSLQQGGGFAGEHDGGRLSAELVGSQNYQGVLPALAPASVYAALAGRGLRVNFAGIGLIKVPTKLSSPLVSGDFVGEGAPIPTRRLGLGATSIGPPKKLVVISHFSDELRRASVPTIEAVLRQGIASDTSVLLDSKLLDNAAASTIRPAGLLNGVTGLTPTTVPGWPDLQFAGPGRQMAFLELKRRGGRLSESQQAMREHLEQCGLIISAPTMSRWRSSG